MIFLCLSPTRLDILKRDSSFHKNLIFPINFFKGKQSLSRRCTVCTHMYIIFARYRHRRSLLSAIIGDFRGGLYLREPSPEVLDAVYRRPCSCASIRHHARSSFANSGKFTKFKCKIGRCSAGSMEARARRRRGGRRGAGGATRNEEGETEGI